MAELETIRMMARNGNIEHKKHCIERMWQRGIRRRDIIEVLKSSSNEIIEIQESTERSPDIRILVYDPKHEKGIIVVLSIQFEPEPKLRVITVEYKDDKVWRDLEQGPPSIQRK